MWQVLRNFGDMVIRKRKKKEKLGSCDILKGISHPCKLKETNTMCYKETVSVYGSFPSLLYKKLRLKAENDCVNMIHNNT